jgi:hypothetical protein
MASVFSDSSSEDAGGLEEDSKDEWSKANEDFRSLQVTDEVGHSVEIN